MTKYLNVIFALFCLALFGCAASGKPMTWVDKNVEFAKYSSFIIMPVENKTGQIFEQDIPAMLTAQLKEQFEKKSLSLVEDDTDSAGVITVEGDLTLYVGGNAFKRWLAPGAGKTQCTLETRLYDKSNGQLVAEIVAAKEVSAGGLYSVGADEWILKDTASTIAKEVVEKIIGAK